MCKEDTVPLFNDKKNIDFKGLTRLLYFSCSPLIPHKGFKNENEEATHCHPMSTSSNQHYTSEIEKYASCLYGRRGVYFFT